MKVTDYTDMLSVHFTGNYSGTSHEKSMKLFAQSFDNCIINKDDLHALKERLEEHSDELMCIHPKWKRSIIEVDVQDECRFSYARAWFKINGNALYTIRIVPALLSRDDEDQREGIRVLSWGAKH